VDTVEAYVDTTENTAEEAEESALAAKRSRGTCCERLSRRLQVQEAGEAQRSHGHALLAGALRLSSSTQTSVSPSLSLVCLLL